MSKNFASFKVSLHPDVDAGFKVLESKRVSGVQTLHQVHGASGTEILENQIQKGVEGDFLWTKTDATLGIFVADCTAILLYGKRSNDRIVAAIHAGWRGTAKGVIENALQVFKGSQELIAWMSPSICAEHYEVGTEVIEELGLKAASFAREHKPHKYLLDLAGYQKFILKNLGVKIKSSSLCTWCQKDFVSYRENQGKLEARQLAWIKLNQNGIFRSTV
jgi:YfiH family protein